MKKIYTDAESVARIVRELNREQNARNEFVNISVTDYKGGKLVIVG